MQQRFDERNRNLIVNVAGRLVHRDQAGVSPFDSSVQGGDAGRGCDSIPAASSGSSSISTGWSSRQRRSHSRPFLPAARSSSRSAARSMRTRCSTACTSG
jgi:hypothetical protein